MYCAFFRRKKDKTNRDIFQYLKRPFTLSKKLPRVLDVIVLLRTWYGTLELAGENCRQVFVLPTCQL